MIYLRRAFVSLWLFVGGLLHESFVKEPVMGLPSVPRRKNRLGFRAAQLANDDVSGSYRRFSSGIVFNIDVTDLVRSSAAYRYPAVFIHKLLRSHLAILAARFCKRNGPLVLCPAGGKAWPS